MSEQTLQEKQYDEAVTARDSLVSSMGSDEFSQDKMDQLKALQSTLREAKLAMDAASASEQANQAEGGEVCRVTLIRGGKSDRTVTVPAGTSMADLIHTLGWGDEPLTYKQRVGPGQTSEIADLSGTSLGPGEHEIFVTPRVAGGV